MEIKESEKVKDLKIIKPVSFYDFRGEYLETFSAKTYKFKDRHGDDVVFMEDDISVSKRGVLRGLHGDDKTWKLIQCLWGEIFVAVVDMRRDSATYLQWDSFSVSDKNRRVVREPAPVSSADCVTAYTHASDRPIPVSHREADAWHDDPVSGPSHGRSPVTGLPTMAPAPRTRIA